MRQEWALLYQGRVVKTLVTVMGESYLRELYPHLTVVPLTTLPKDTLDRYSA